MSKLLTFKARRNPKLNTAISFGVFLFGLFLCGGVPTQWFAAKYGFDPNLGEAWFSLGAYPVYWPLDWLIWGWSYGDIDGLRQGVHGLMMIGTGTSLIAVFVAVGVSIWLGKYDNGMEGLHGTAHWAEYEEVNNTGFMSHDDHEAKGVVVGSVLLDRRGQVIHPHHPKYARRYKKMMVRREGWKGWIGFKKQLRDEHGMPRYMVEKSIVKSIKILMDGKNTHIFGFCPTRSGKGVAMVLPTLLTWPKSVMVNDPKGEAYALTAGFRAMAGQKIIKFAPASTDGTGARWNPLGEIRVFTTFDVKDAQMIMSMACDPKGEGLEDYFDKAGYEFLTGLALHVCYAEKNGSLEGIAQFLGDPNWDNDKQMYHEMMQAVHDPEGKMGWVDSQGNKTKTHPMVANAAKTMSNKEEKDRSGVLSTAKSLLSLYLDPIVARNTNCSDFKVRDLMTHESPVSLYYVVSPDDMQRLVPLTRLFYDLFIRRNAAEMEFADGRSSKSYSFELLMILDEMTSLRKLPIIQEALGYVAGYGIRMFMLVQDIAQVEDFYGEKQTIESGAETRVVYAPNRTETAEKISRMAGKTTITESKGTQSVDGMGFKAGNVSLSTEKHARDLIGSEEVMTLHDHDVLIFVKGQPPIYGRKAFYYENPVLLGRAKIPPPAHSAVLRIAEKPEKIVIKRDASEPVSKEELLAANVQQWQNDRLALLNRIRDDVAVKNEEQVAPPQKGAVMDSVQVKPVARQNVAAKKSRFADTRPVLSDADRAKISGLVADIALSEKIAKISAFSDADETIAWGVNAADVHETNATAGLAE